MKEKGHFNSTPYKTREEEMVNVQVHVICWISSLKQNHHKTKHWKDKAEVTIAVLDVDISLSVVEWETQKRKLPSPNRDYSGTTKNFFQ